MKSCADGTLVSSENSRVPAVLPTPPQLAKEASCPQAPLSAGAPHRGLLDSWDTEKHRVLSIPGRQILGADISGHRWRAAGAYPVAAYSVDRIPQDGAHSGAGGHIPGNGAWKWAK